MTTLRIAWRVLRGGGPRGALRLVLMTLGVAVGVTAVLFIQAMPGVLDHRGEVSGDREPAYATGGAATTYRFDVVEGVWDGVRFTRVLIADVTTGASVPPGLAALPRPGQVFLSPSARERMVADAAFRQLVPGTPAGTIAPAGLVDPYELYAYVGVSARELGHAAPGAGWGGAPDQREAGKFSGVTLELAALILGPTIIYLLVCAGLSASTRTRRYSALRLVGADRAMILRIAAIEAAVSGAGGGLLGIGLYAVANQWIGLSNVVGFAWYPSTSRLAGNAAAVALVLIAVGSALVAVLGTRRALTQPLAGRFDVAEPVPRWWHAAPLFVGLGLLAVPLLIDRRPSSAGGEYAQANNVVAAVLIAGMATCCLGLVLALRPLLAMVARALAKARIPMPARIAARRVELEPAGTVRLMSGLVMLILVAGIGAGVLHLVELSALPLARTTSASVQAREIPAAARAAALQTPARQRWVVDTSVVTPPGHGFRPNPADIDSFVRAIGIPLVAARCADAAAVLGTALRGCVDGTSYRLVDARADPRQVPSLPAGYPLQYLDGNGKQFTLRAPAADLRYRDSSGPGLPQILITAPTPPQGIAPTANLSFILSTDPARIDEFLSRLAAASPTATATINNFDLDLLEVYKTQHGTIQFGVAVGFLLGMLAFAMAAIDRTVERRRQISALAVLGFRPRTLRWIQFLQHLGSVGLSLIAAMLVAHIVGNAFLRLDNIRGGFFYGTITSALPLLLVGLVVAALTSLVVAGARPRAEDLRRE